MTRIVDTSPTRHFEPINQTIIGLLNSWQTADVYSTQYKT